jgi:hypothetical protein
MQAERRLSGGWRRSVMALTAVLAFILAMPPALHAADINFPPTDYVIRSGDGARIIGHAHFELRDGPDGLRTVHGDYHYLNGDSDVEDDTIRIPQGSSPPSFVRFRHVFYNPDGSISRSGEADVTAGYGQCTIYKNGVARTTRDQLNFPPDTFAGAAVIIALRDYLMSAPTDHRVFHVFNCVPGPKVLKVALSVHRQARWAYYPGDLVEVGLKPDFGWLNIVIGPFLPTLRVWFDPADDWFFTGSKSARYYKGSDIMLVRAYRPEPASGGGGPELPGGGSPMPTTSAAPTPMPSAASR